MMNKRIKITTQANDSEINKRQAFFEIFRQCPLPESELLSNLELFMKRQDISRILFLDDIYRRILGVHGIIMEFGVRWGRQTALMASLRGIYEPFNHNRKIVGFDTFTGFEAPDDKDGGKVMKGDYSTTDNYQQYLEKVMDYHETESPLSHIKKFEIIKGDASTKVYEYLQNHPETIIAFAYFDMDVYEPTKKCLEAIKGRLTRGSVIGFDELNHSMWPGETLALLETIGIDKYAVKRNIYGSGQSFIVID